MKRKTQRMPALLKESKEEADAMDTSPRSEKSSVVSGQLKKQIERKQKNASKMTKPERGVVFIKNIPHGFLEEQIKKYFEQFGRVTRVRLVRSKRTGHDRGFAFIEFLYPEVAEEAAKSMHNYLMFNKLVKAAYIPPDEQKFNYFKTSVKAVRNAVGKVRYISTKTRRQIKYVTAANNWVADNYLKRLSNGNKKIKNIKNAIGTLGLDPDFVSDIMPRLDQLKDLLNAKKKEFEANTEGLTDSDDMESEKNNSSSISDQKEDDNISPKAESLLLVKKRRSSPEEVQEKPKKKKKIELKDLLENTIPDDSSSDEDFIPLLEEEAEKPKKKKKAPELKHLLENTIQDDSSSDEDFIPLTEEGNDNSTNNSNESDHSSPSENESESHPKHFVKIPKSSNTDKLNRINRGKPYSGAIQKPKKKNKNKKGNAKQQLIKTAAIEIVKQGITKNIKKKSKKGKINA